MPLIFIVVGSKIKFMVMVVRTLFIQLGCISFLKESCTSTKSYDYGDVPAVQVPGSSDWGVATI